MKDCCDLVAVSPGFSASLPPGVAFRRGGSVYWAWPGLWHWPAGLLSPHRASVDKLLNLGFLWYKTEMEKKRASITGLLETVRKAVQGKCCSRC